MKFSSAVDIVLSHSAEIAISHPLGTAFGCHAEDEEYCKERECNYKCVCFIRFHVFFS